ncbi:asparagine synthetase B [Luteitalea sp. TBR-22]|uniref:asparagine synthase (glutamine-hydrolyzing) n=1 Tax=Luteitalea sp. TBR-22 TaxID=2802971 RepID=UPI001AF3DF7D|nr:asparagine synthase (glutamine-hydrolyzing) [Luteitalea sp. TBR-22]BCS33207.1 asparagine synthetase B [Luteitalea sp. TBR-22]
MCGIAGRVNYRTSAPVSAADVTAMCDLLRHRGPDGSGVWSDGPVGLGHRRLAVIDLSPAGAQPMASADGRLFITFNGEIYNFQELRGRLEARGHRFRSHSDTEVILAAYREYGDGCVEHLAGMFAFAIWDADARRALIARDRLGKKPVFYRQDADGLAFASEVRAFFGDPGFTASVDPQSIADYLSFQYVPTPRSAFAGVQKLPAAHVMVIEDGRCDIRRYWSLSYVPKSTLSEDEALEAVEESLTRAVTCRMVSDVPLGAFLSGGVDSGTIVALMARHSSSPVRTFSIGFPEEQYNELPAARLVAQKYGTRHEELIVEPDAVRLIPKIVWHYGEPYADPSALPSFCLAEMTRRHVTVALNGDGGDESFAGYRRYTATLEGTPYDAVPRGLRGLPAAVAAPVARAVGGELGRRAAGVLERIGATPEHRYAASMLHFDARRKREMCTPEFLSQVDVDVVPRLDALFASSTGPDLIDRMMDVDIRSYLVDDLLVKVDVATMAYSLEARSPLLDHRLMELAASLPSHYKIRSGTKKYLLRRIAARLLPPEIMERPKTGFGVPLDRWFASSLQSFAREILLDPVTVRRGILRREAVERMLREHAAGVRESHRQIWNLLMLEHWFRAYIDRRPSRDEQSPA